MKELEDSVLIINALSRTINNNKDAIINEIENGLESVKEINENKFTHEQVLVRSALDIIIIQVSAFQDEWTRNFLRLRDQGVEPARITKIENIVRPAIDIINSYSGLKDYRNWFLAHNLRKKDGKEYINALRKDLLFNINKPNSIHEILMLSDCVFAIAAIVRQEFIEYYKHPSQFIRDNNDIDKANKGLEYKECESMIKKMHSQIKLNWEASIS